jgi:hypothetical protein
MKIVVIIFTVLMLVGTAFVSLAGANKSHKLAGDLAELTKGLSEAEMKSVAKDADLPSTGRLNGGAIVGGLGGLAALALLVVTFAKKPLVKAVGGATVACAALSAVLYPHIETGPADGAAPRSLAIAAIVMAIIGAGGAVFATKKQS